MSAISIPVNRQITFRVGSNMRFRLLMNDSAPTALATRNLAPDAIATCSNDCSDKWLLASNEVGSHDTRRRAGSMRNFPLQSFVGPVRRIRRRTLYGKSRGTVMHGSNWGRSVCGSGCERSSSIHGQPSNSPSDRTRKPCGSTRPHRAKCSLRIAGSHRLERPPGCPSSAHCQEGHRRSVANLL